MPNLSDAAALSALGPGLGGGAMPEMPMPAPDEMAAAPAEGGMEAGIAMIETELAGAPPELADEARVHINALRDIGSKMGGGEAPMEVPPAEEPPIPAPGTEV